MIRQPIVCILGHVDHGKTTLLDKIRKTAVAAKEAGGITQAIGATEIPYSTIKNICGKLMEKFKINVEIPGLLFIDTPGHEAFTSLRKRGGSCADFALLVVDINEGFKAQTIESLELLKHCKTPFAVAANKIDKIEGWVKYPDSCFLESFEKQPEYVRARFEEKLYKLVGQLSQHGFDSERFDRVNDFKKTVGIIPSSGLTGEGIPEILVILSGLAQQFLRGKLEINEEIGRGSVLEVKEVKGLGLTIDAIIYDGVVRKGDWLIIGGKEPKVTKIKSLLKPPSLKELRVEKQFDYVDEVRAAAGIKIGAPDLEGVVAGSPIATVRDESQVNKIKEEMRKAVEEIEFESELEGVILKADNLGSLEALIHIMKSKNIPIKKAEVGNILRRDVSTVEAIKDLTRKVILAFNVGIDELAERDAKDKNIKIIKSNIIYKIFEDYDRFVSEQHAKIREQKLSSITRPAKIKLLPGMVFRHSNPVIAGVEVLSGFLKPGVSLQKNGKEIGVLKALQEEGTSVASAKTGERVAASIEGPTIGRQIDEGDILITIISKEDLKILEELGMKDEIELAKEILKK